LVWQVTLKIKKGNLEEIKKKLETYIEKREQSQPRLPSAGCIFKNIPFNYLEQQNEKLTKIALRQNIIKKDKIGAAWLIDSLGLKGKKVGGAKISLEHANFIVNTGRAQAHNVAMLISEIKREVKDKYNIELSEEVQYLS